MPLLIMLVVRRAVLPWIVYLAALYILVAVATVLILSYHDGGFW